MADPLSGSRPARLTMRHKLSLDQAMRKVGEGTSSRDPAVGLRAVAALRRLLESLEALHVQNARAQDWTWQEIATALGVSKQAVHQKHSDRVSDEGKA